eukprot:scaffold24893_cov27-Tisochrysis_lutea.AAC.4
MTARAASSLMRRSRFSCTCAGRQGENAMALSVSVCEWVNIRVAFVRIRDGRGGVQGWSAGIRVSDADQ